jgi:hypothetical protein
VTRPEKGTPEWDLWLAAIDIAAAAPLRQTPNTHAAQIPWWVIHELRSALTKLGIDWEKVKRDETRRRDEARRNR